MPGEIIFSIILPVCHGGNLLRSTIASLQQLEFPPNEFEVIVVGTVGDEESYNIVKEGSRSSNFSLFYRETSDDNRSAQLNTGCAIARGRILAFADDDCIFMPDWLRNINSVMDREYNVGIIGGKDHLIRTNSSFDMSLDHVLNSFIGTGGMRNRAAIQTGKYYPKLWNMAVPRKVAMDIALQTEREIPEVFNESLIVHEDVDLAHRIEQSGKRIIFATEVCIGHNRDTTFLSFVRRNFIMARTSRSLGIHRFPHVALALFAIGTPCIAFTSFFLTSMRFVIIPLIGLYILALLASAVKGFVRTNRTRVFALVPILLVSLHFTRGIGYFFPWSNRLREKSL